MQSSHQPKENKPKLALLLIMATVFAAAWAWFVFAPKQNRNWPSHPIGEVALPPPPAAISSTTTPSSATPSGTVVAQPAPTSAGVEIQEAKTIDFSSGKPVLKDSAEEKALIAQSVKEMEAAAKEVSFGPPVKKPTPTIAPVKP